MPVSPELLPIVRAQLKEGEGVGWAVSAEPVAFQLGKRRKGIWDAVAILGGGYAAVGSTVATFRSGQPLWMLLPLTLIGLGVLTYFALERIKARARKRVECTVYALTTRRALLIHTFPKLTVQALPIESITDVVLDNVREAFGDLTLTTSAAATGLVFRGVFEPEQARKDMQKVLRDPTGAEQQIAASERYMMAMRQFGQGTRGH